MGAGPLPVDGGGAAHPPRPPIPIVPVDEAARAAALVRLPAELDPATREQAAWLAAVAPRGATLPPVRLPCRWDGAAAQPPLDIGLVAAAVDAGRAAARRERARGAAVLVPLESPDGAHAEAAARVRARLGAGDGPLRTLRREGTAALAVACGLALGAGEHGVGCCTDGPEGAAGAAVAVALEPALAARVRSGAAGLETALAVLSHADPPHP